MPRFLGLKTEVLNFLTLVKRPQMDYMSPDDLSTQEKVSSMAQGKIDQNIIFRRTIWLSWISIFSLGARKFVIYLKVEFQSYHEF